MLRLPLHHLTLPTARFWRGCNLFPLLLMTHQGISTLLWKKSSIGWHFACFWFTVSLPKSHGRTSGMHCCSEMVLIELWTLRGAHHITTDITDKWTWSCCFILLLWHHLIPYLFGNILWNIWALREILPSNKMPLQSRYTMITLNTAPLALPVSVFFIIYQRMFPRTDTKPCWVIVYLQTQRICLLSMNLNWRVNSIPKGKEIHHSVKEWIQLTSKLGITNFNKLLREKLDLVI